MQAELQNGIITGYTIKYQSLTESDNGVVQVGPNDRQANLTGLKEFVEYNSNVILCQWLVLYSVTSNDAIL